MRPLLFGAIAACLLLWVALYNGYPTVFADTGSYLYTGAFLIALPPFRAPGYGIFVMLTSLGTSGWFTIAAQAIIVITVLYEACGYLIGDESTFRDSCLLAIVCGLAALTSLPWEVSELMPDVFAGVAFLAAFLLAFDAQLPLARRIILSIILTISISAHLSLLPIVTVFVAALAIPALAGYRPQGAPPAKSMLAWLLVPVIAAGLWTATLNRRTGLGFELSASGNEFLLGSLFSKGLAQDFLRENCPQKPFVACRYLTNLPATASEFMFWNPLLHEMEGHRGEIQEVVLGTIAAHPLRFVTSCIGDTLRQFATFRTGDEIRETGSPNSNAIVIGQVFPRDSRSFLNAKQSRGSLTRIANSAAMLDTPVFWMSVLMCPFLAWTKREAKVNRFFCAGVAFLVINAAICSTFSGVFERYQGRVAWIAPLCLMSYVCCLVKERSARTREDAASSLRLRLQTQEMPALSSPALDSSAASDMLE